MTDHYDVIIIGTGADGGNTKFFAPVLFCMRRENFGGITLHYQITNGETHKHLIQKLKDVLHQLHCNDKVCYCNDHILPDKFFLDRTIPLAGVAHQWGTVHFGNDPKTSALDVNCKAHDLDNLYVVDASFFISSGAVNPSLTIMANALRVGDHLLERMK
ncbi:MAG TPA: GMC oxidoreductase [Anaerolineales bacterium]